MAKPGKAHVAAVEALALTIHFGRKLVLDSLDLVVPAGGIHGLIGANGSGKTTLIRTLRGKVAPTDGRLLLFGRDVRERAVGLRRSVAFIDAKHQLPSTATVGSLVERAKRRGTDWDETTYQRSLLGSEIPDRTVSDLTRGQRALLKLALAVARRPSLVLLDEPTRELDAAASGAFLEALLMSGVAKQSTILYCSHDMSEIERVSDNLIVLERGRLRLTGPPDRCRDRVSHWASDIPFGCIPEPEIPGLLQAKLIGGVHHHLVMDQGDDFAAFLRSRGARATRRAELDFETAMKAVIGGSRLSA